MAAAVPLRVFVIGARTPSGFLSFLSLFSGVGGAALKDRLRLGDEETDEETEGAGVGNPRRVA